MVGGLGSLTPIERARRFWTAHGRSADDLTVLHAFCVNPAVAWSPERLCMWYGIRIDRAHRIVDEFVRCGIVRPAPRGEHGYRWNDAHDWAVPRTPATRWVVQERWAAKAGTQLPMSQIVAGVTVKREFGGEGCPRCEASRSD